METTKIPEHTCDCGYHMDATSGAGHSEPPREGCVSLCINCGRIWLFNADLTQREPSQSELTELAKTPDWEFVVKAREIILKRYAL